MSCLAASTFRIAYSAEASQLLAAWTFLWLFASDFPCCLNTTIDKKGGTEYIKDCHDYRGIARQFFLFFVFNIRNDIYYDCNKSTN